MSIEDRIATIADESFGPFPMQDVETNLTEIERGIHIFHTEITRMKILLEQATVIANELVHYGDPKPWRIKEWKTAKDAALRLCTSNPSRLGTGHLVHGTQHGVVVCPDSDLKG